MLRNQGYDYDIEKFERFGIPHPEANDRWEDA
jgi:hypothetical protein